MKKIIPFIISGIIILITIISSIIIINIPKKTKDVSSKMYDTNLINFVEEEIIIVDLSELEDENVVEEELEPIDEEKIKKEAKQTTNTTMPYYIRVNCQAQVVNIYKKDDDENYTIPVKAMICSTGSSTPKSGIYSMPGRRTRWRNLYGGVTGQYVTNIVGAILFHSVPYLTYGDNGSLEYWEYDKLGTAASMGCVRLTVRDAKWIYENCGAGTQVEFYYDSNPGPFGKPSAKKISSNESCRDWDPTDPDSDNPWINYKEPENEKQNQINNVVENKIENKVENKIENKVSNVVENKIENEKTNKTKTNNVNTDNGKNNTVKNNEVKKENTTTTVKTNTTKKDNEVVKTNTTKKENIKANVTSNTI